VDPFPPPSVPPLLPSGRQIPLTKEEAGRNDREKKKKKKEKEKHGRAGEQRPRP